MEPRPDGKVPSAGDVLNGKYVVERVIAEGGMGVVLAARHARLGHRVALKVLQPYTRSVPHIAGRFEREARAAALIKSRNVARVIDVETLPDGSPVMVMEFLEGHDLGVELEDRGALPPSEAVGYALEACAGMAEAHRLGIVHRDLKPSNLFLAVEDGRHVLKVLDFGISKLTADADTRMTATNSVLGTPLYMSPEQVRSAKNVDARTDIWSLGVILYEMLSGELPFMGESATAVAASIVADDVIPLASRRPGLPPGLADIVMKALSKKPDARFQDIAELASALRPYDGKARSRRPSTLILLTGAAAAEVSPDARTLDESGAGDDASPASTVPGTEESLLPPPRTLASEPPKAEAPPTPAPVSRDRADREPPTGGTVPGWTGAAPSSAQTGKRRALVVGVAVVGVLAVVGTARSLLAPREPPRTEAAAESATAATAGRAPAPEPASTASGGPIVTAEPSASAAPPIVSPATAPRPSAEPAPLPSADPSGTAKKPQLPRTRPGPTAPPAAPSAPSRPAGLPSHI